MFVCVCGVGLELELCLMRCGADTPFFLFFLVLFPLTIDEVGLVLFGFWLSCFFFSYMYTLAWYIHWPFTYSACI